MSVKGLSSLGCVTNKASSKSTSESPRKRRKTQTAVERIHHNTNAGDHGPEGLVKPPLIHIQPSKVQRGHSFPNVSIYDQSTVHLGDIYNIGHKQRPNEVLAFGLCLASAPLIDSHHFIGRARELDQMKQILQPGYTATELRKLVLGGMGGIGKTQLAIAYARHCQADYTSVFWLNATTESTLKQSFRSIVRRLLKAPELEKLDDEQIVPRAHDWLCDTRNTQWLLIFDNYDDPDRFGIKDYIPNTAHGSTIITTRLPDLVSVQPMRVQPIAALDEGLVILQTRSQRGHVKEDPDAIRLVKRLAGLPLALVTAGAYLRKTTLTFHQYLEAYDQSFDISPRQPVQLHDYRDRTLYTTWNLSYSRLKNHDPLAAKALKLLAYFDSQELWYELFHAGLTDDLPMWLRELAAEQIDFENAMGTLVDYCLVEAHPATQSYSIHSCVHDWTLVELNKAIDPQLYWYSLNCIASSTRENDWESLGQLSCARLARHAARCAHYRFRQSVLLDVTAVHHLSIILWAAAFLASQLQLSTSEQMYQRALVGLEKALGPNHIRSLHTINNLGLLSIGLGKLEQAERMYERALARLEKTFGLEHPLTLDTVKNIGDLYRDQGRIDEAEQMYKRALGPDHVRTLSAVNSLATLYSSQGKLERAEQMHKRALAGREKALGVDHALTIDTVNDLGFLYSRSGKLDEAEHMYKRGLARQEKALGSDHIWTLHTVRQLGTLYANQGKLEEAERMYARAISAYQNILHLSKPPQADVHSYATVLCKSIRTGNTNPSFARSKITRLIQLVKDNGKGNAAIIRTLARAMVFGKDENNAQAAYRFSVRCLGDGHPDFSGIHCNGCNHQITVDMGFHVCTQCVDTDLCDRCMADYSTTALAPATCSGHAFFDVDTAGLRSMDPTALRSKVGFDAWIEEISDQYDVKSIQ